MKIVFIIVLIGAIGFASPAYAYLDPGTGSMLVQMLLGGIAGVLVIGKLYWTRIKGIFVRRLEKEERQEPDSDSDAD